MAQRLARYPNAIGTDGALTLVGTVSAGPSAFMIATTF
jgi:uncharacterized membrane protein